MINSTKNGTVPKTDGKSTKNGTLKSTKNGTQNLKEEPNNNLTRKEYPDWLNVEAWEDYLQHRKEIKSPMTPLAEKKSFNIICGLSKSEQQECIDKTIAKGWTGLFPPEKKQTQEYDPMRSAI